MSGHSSEGTARVSWEIRQGDALERLREMPDESVHCCVTSPPYFGLRDYGHEGQLGLEETPDEYVANLVAVLREVRRVLRDDGTLWLNLGDTWNSYNANRGGSASISDGRDGAGRGHPQHRRGLVAPNLKAKDMIGVPWMVAFALRADGWFLRSEVIWHKPNPMPESIHDRPTQAHERIFLLTKRPRYHYDADAIREDFADERMGNPGQYRKTAAPDRSGFNTDRGDLGFVGAGGGWSRGAENGGRNKRSVWAVTTQPFPGAHFATFPPKLIEPCILAGCPENGTVLDPFAGASTTGLVATRLDRSYVGIELNPEYVELGRRRILDDAPLLNAGTEVAA